MSEANEAAKARAPGRVEELHRADFEHLELGHWPAVASSADQHLLAAARGGSLPYDVLDSHAFERLCFHLLLAKSGGPARFWGRTAITDTSNVTSSKAIFTPAA